MFKEKVDPIKQKINTIINGLNAHNAAIERKKELNKKINEYIDKGLIKDRAEVKGVRTVYELDNLVELLKQTRKIKEKEFRNY